MMPKLLFFVQTVKIETKYQYNDNDVFLIGLKVVPNNAITVCRLIWINDYLSGILCLERACHCAADHKVCYKMRIEHSHGNWW